MGHARLGPGRRATPRPSRVTCIAASGDGRLDAPRATGACSGAAAARSPGRPWCSAASSVGAIELSDAGDRDFSRHADALDGLARICAEADGRPAHHDGELAHRNKTVRELVDLSREVAQTHDFERFVVSFAQRLLAAANADCVDVWRVSEA